MRQLQLRQALVGFLNMGICSKCGSEEWCLRWTISEGAMYHLVQMLPSVPLLSTFVQMINGNNKVFYKLMI